MPSLSRILANLQSIRFGAAAIADVHADFVALATAAPAPTKPQAAIPFSREFALRGISFVYPGAPRRVLENIDLVIPRGESLGIVGATGSGKSTLLDIVTGLLDPVAGDILLDGASIRGDMTAWQRRLGYVTQMVFLIDDTLRANIAFGIPAAEIEAARLDTAVHIAQHEDVVAQLPSGLDTVVG